MPQDEAPRTDRLGVAKLDLFFSQHGWLFREQLVHDHGIDAQVEIVSDQLPTGKLIAIQVKSGSSYFNERTADGNYIFRAKARHADYWQKHCLPVIVVLYDPATELLLWEAVNESTLQSAGNGWKIKIPVSNSLVPEVLDELANLAQPPDEMQKLNRLRLDRAWMELVNEDEVVYVEFEDWVNKSLARFQIRIGCESRDDIDEQSWPMVYGPGISPEEALSYVIPWADFSVDEDEHRFGMEEIWDAECYICYDKEEGKAVHSMPFDSWYTYPEGIVPCSEDGEVSYYKLILSLSEIGKAFLAMDDFLKEERILLYGAE